MAKERIQKVGRLGRILTRGAIHLIDTQTHREREKNHTDKHTHREREAITLRIWQLLFGLNNTDIIRFMYI